MKMPTQTGRIVQNLRERIETLEEAGLDPSEGVARKAGDKANADAILAETEARVAAAKAASKALADETDRAKAAESSLQDRIVPLSGTLTLSAGISIGIGKTPRAIAVPGIRKGDVVALAPGAALPGNLSLGDAYCLKDGELTLALTVSGIAALAVTSSVSIPIAIRALR